MMRVLIRPATAADARAMAELLNEIIRIGGTTAHTSELTTQGLTEFMQGSDQVAWHIATDEAGTVLGFQSIEAYASLPDGACDISTFVKVGITGLGIGSQLFEATRSAAEALGFDWINADIRADNESGLAYYQSRGFRRWGEKQGVKLESGLVVDKVLMRYDLKD